MSGRFTMFGCTFLLLAGCSSEDAAPPDAPPAQPDASVPDASIPDATPPPDGSFMPETLRETGMYADFENKVLADNVRRYQTAYQLWSDGAGKYRYIMLPEGSKIDSADMDFWVYPVGTKIWKEFERDGVLLETRFMYKTGPLPFNWYMVSYAWNEDQTEAVALPEGALDVMGTTHDIPSKEQCGDCHRFMPDKVIGFSAIMLDHQQDGTTLRDLVNEGLLTNLPEASAPPFFPLPGDDTARTALGYIHANCGGCHNTRSDHINHVPINMRLGVNNLGTVEETSIYMTTVGVTPTLEHPPTITSLVEPGNPEASGVHMRMSSRVKDEGMPPLGTEVVDNDGVAAVEAWIMSLAGAALQSEDSWHPPMR